MVGMLEKARIDFHRLVRALLAARPNLVVSVSHTTRKPRAQEVEGRDYCFVTPARFHELAAQGAFLEHASVFDNFYGTGRAQIAEKLAAGKDVLLEIDWQGARQVRRAIPAARRFSSCRPHGRRSSSDCASAGTDSAGTIARRLADASSDMSHYREFDFVVVNDQFEQAAMDLSTISTVAAERCVPTGPSSSR